MKGHTQDPPDPGEKTLVRKTIVADNMTRNLAYFFSRKSKQLKFLPHCLQQYFSPMCTIIGMVSYPLGAGKWLLSCVVCPFMLLQITILLKCFITLGTCKWLLSCIYPFMHLQSGSVNKSIVTNGTGKWLHQHGFVHEQRLGFFNCKITIKYWYCGIGIEY